MPQILVLIPIKDFMRTKTRIKRVLPSSLTKYIDILVEKAFLQTFEIVRSLSYPIGVITPSKSIISKSKVLGATFTYHDSGIDLNKALSEAVQRLPLEHPILIIMPDLPFMTEEFLHEVVDKTKDLDVLILASISNEKVSGTAALYLRRRDLLSFQFGTDSCNLFQTEAEEKRLKYCVLHFDPFTRDLDTIKDVKYLQKHLTLVPNPNKYVTILDHLNI